MSFQWPVMLVALLLVPLGMIVARRIDRRRRGRVAGLTGSGPGVVAAGAGGTRGTGARRVLDRLGGALVVGAFAIGVVALARPQATVALPRLEGTVMLVIDVSGSMAADDAQPTRMEAAKAIATSIVDRRPEGVVLGIAAFSDGGMAVQAPTSDMTRVAAAIERLAPTRGTSVGSGIDAALDAIEKARATTPPEYYSNRSPEPSAAPAPVEPGSDAATLVVVISDGENNERPDPALVARAAADRGIRIHAIGVGTTGGAILDLDGFRVNTRLDEGTLQELADITGGSYAAAADGDPAPRVYDQLARALVVRDESVELTGLLAGAALVLLLTGAAVSLARQGRLP